MARTLTPAAAAAAGRTVTRPLYLVEIQWATGPVSRLSSGADVSWNSLSWSGNAKLSVSGITATGNAEQAGQLSLGNVDLAFGALALGSIADTPVRIWHAHADALGVADPHLVFDGVVDSAEVSEQTVTLALGPASSRAVFAPRLTVGPDAGFTVLLPAGTKIPVGNQVFILER